VGGFFTAIAGVDRDRLAAMDWAIAEEVEHQDLQPYTQRLERRRRTSTREPSSSRYGEKAAL
jgi:hypothetical protein